MTTDYDIVVIGGGIHGAGALQAAAAAGYSCLLLEQYPQAAMGTSSRSSKLIHGGLRYLESGELKLVYECLYERKLLLRNAPGLVKLKPFVIPVYANAHRSSWIIRIGLSIYSLLAGLGKKVRFKSIPRRQWSRLPGLKQAGLKSVYQYADAQTDDAALTKAVLRSAESLGAQILYNTEFQQASHENTHYQVRFLHNDTRLLQTVTAATIINAAGPWVNRVMDRIYPEPDKMEIEWIRGSHILLPGPADDRIYYLESPTDNRAIFVMPWRNDILVGTTEQFHFNNPDKVEPENEEIEYLLNIFNFYFPDFYAGTPASAEMIKDRFAGLRVLPKDELNPFQRSRETLFGYDHKQKPRLAAIYGGKLTSYRATSAKVLRTLKPQLPKRKAKADTRKLRLTTECTETKY